MEFTAGKDNKTFERKTDMNNQNGEHRERYNRKNKENRENQPLSNVDGNVTSGNNNRMFCFYQQYFY